MFKNMFDKIVKKAEVELDGANTLFLEEELKRVETETYDTEFPENQYTQILPIIVTNEPGVKTISYKQFTPTGIAKIITNYADDLPNLAKFVKEFFKRVYTIAVSYQYDWEEVESAAMNRMNLPSDMAITAREVVDRKMDNFFLLGDSAAGVKGFFDMDNVQSYTIPNGATGSSKLWSTKTPDEIIEDINATIHQAGLGTEWVEEANMVGLGPARYTYIASTPRSSTSDTTILDFVKMANPGVNFMAMKKLEGVLGAGNGERMIAYNKSARKVRARITYAFTQKPAQEVNLAFKVPCLAKIAGVQSPYPLSIVYADGI